MALVRVDWCPYKTRDTTVSCTGRAGPWEEGEGGCGHGEGLSGNQPCATWTLDFSFQNDEKTGFRV